MKLLPCLLLTVCMLRADIRIAETTSVKVAGKKAEVARITLLQGKKMRTEVKSSNRSGVALMDLEREEVISFDPAKRSGEVRTFSGMRALADQKVDRDKVVSSTAPTGKSDKVAGYNCTEHQFNVKAPTQKGGRTYLVLSGTMCVSKDAMGVEEYHRFLAAAKEHGALLQFTQDTSLLVVMAVEQTEMYRMIEGLGGIPLKIDSSLRYEGFGAWLLNRLAAVRHSQVTAISDEALPKTSFDVPDGFQLVRK